MKKAICNCILLLAALPMVFAQTRFQQDTVWQQKYKNEKLIPHYVTLNPSELKKWPEWKVIGFKIENVDGNYTTLWKSPLLLPLDKNEAGYFIKADIPAAVVPFTKSTWCYAVYINTLGKLTDTLEMRYGGVNLGRIRLNLHSSPVGAEVYMIPNSVWMSKFKNTDWKKKLTDWTQIVYAPVTNTYVMIDETVYVLVFKMGNTFKQKLFQTKPERVQNVQDATISF